MTDLKDFQRRTVDYALRRMYLDTPSARRFLVADEVGLGKTLVARGIVEGAVKQLTGKVDRIDIVYVCSNASIAEQNINRLFPRGANASSSATRLTLVPLKLQDLTKSSVNYIAFTPGTTFDLASRSGTMQERAVIYHALRGKLGLSDATLANLLRCAAGQDSWRGWTKVPMKLDEALVERFVVAVQRDEKTTHALPEVSDRFAHARKSLDVVYGRLQYSVVGRLRKLLAHTCVDALEPDLVILDEFQRFKDIMDGGNEAAQLARTLFEYPDVRVLLLSATPYRMLTLNGEAEEDHYGDFVRTLRFLFESDAEIEAVQNELKAFRKALYAETIDAAALEGARDAVATRLRSVMSRTERIDCTTDGNAFLTEPSKATLIDTQDLHDARATGEVAVAVGAGDVVEYWKSGPYVLNFMREYDLKKRLQRVSEAPPDALVAAVKGGRLLKRSQFERYEPIDPANARLRALMHDAVGGGQWQHLWIPPALPYLSPAEPFTSAPASTKSLVFSAWNVVPDAIAGLCSYEVERLMLGKLTEKVHHHELTRKRPPLLKFEGDSLTTLAMLYASPTLAQLVDPLAEAIRLSRDRPVNPDVLRAAVKEKLSPLVASAVAGHSVAKGQVDPRWYWAIVAKIEAVASPDFGGTLRNANSWREKDAQEEDTSGFARQTGIFYECFNGSLQLGRPPELEELLDVVADLALAGPGVCALRSLHRVAPQLPWTNPELFLAANRISFGFRALFNQPEATALLRADDDVQAYWRRVLNYCIAGNLQSLLDEYVHVSLEAEGLLGHDPVSIAKDISIAAAEALTLRASQVQVEEIACRHGRLKFHRFNLRARFAMRFGDVRDEENVVSRITAVRRAFNSPFRPFVLASTSIGQEGLDFHPYCHAIYHWNLPANPVDLEQREGRVHRYKGHAVRKNVAADIGLAGLRSAWRPGTDPWQTMFELAAARRTLGDSELVPYWIYEIPHGSKVERRVPMLPFSSEHKRLARLKEMLAVYRMVFGQPRQEDLLSHLQVQAEKLESLPKYRISLVPLKWTPLSRQF